jgi:uncharacterized protein (TIGR00255 family)
MMKSMTGFGKAVAEIAGRKITVEVRSLNSKGLDLNVRMPYTYKEKELELRSEVSRLLERGKVDLSIYSEASQEVAAPAINRTLAAAYYNELKSFASQIGEEGCALLPLVLKMPDVLKAEREVVELDENEWQLVRGTVTRAIEDFQKFRDDEGATLAKEFDARIAIIGSLLLEVVALDSLRIQNIKERIRTNLADAIDIEKIDSNRFEQELIYYIEKLDITEEKLRLKTHLDYFTTTMKEAGSGRKLGFISQEIGREINTIGSKANDAAIQKLVVQMKDELEKIKEQMLNVL